MENNKKIQRWSYSRVNTFKTCPRLFELQYIEKVRSEDNAFSQFGSMCHEILEEYANGELKLDELLDEFRGRFDVKVTAQFPDLGFMDLAKKYYQDGTRFFNEFMGFEDDTIAVEEKLNFIIKREDGEDINFVGIMDRLSVDSDGVYSINDYKSKGKFKNKAEQADYFKQLYLYAIEVKNRYGLDDDKLKLKLNLFRLQQEFTEKYDSEKANKIQKDFTDMVSKIENAKEYPCNPNDFFCQNLCGVSPIDCEYRNKDKWKK